MLLDVDCPSSWWMKFAGDFLFCYTLDKSFLLPMRILLSPILIFSSRYFAIWECYNKYKIKHQQKKLNTSMVEREWWEALDWDDGVDETRWKGVRHLGGERCRVFRANYIQVQQKEKRIKMAGFWAGPLWEIVQDQDAGLREGWYVTYRGISESQPSMCIRIFWRALKGYQCPTSSPRNYDIIGQEWILPLAVHKNLTPPQWFSCVDGVENKLFHVWAFHKNACLLISKRRFHLK